MNKQFLQRGRSVLLVVFSGYMLFCAVGADTARVYDPWEKYNRSVFRFNLAFNEAFLIPLVESTYLKVPEVVRVHLGSFSHNFYEPIFGVNWLLQGNIAQAADTFGRFLINTVFGIAGLFDVAAANGLPYRKTSFGDTLAVWGVHPGPYVILPFLVPMNLRALFGAIVASFANPVAFLLCMSCSTVGRFSYTFPIKLSQLAYDYGPYLSQANLLSRTSLDFYVFTRHAYYGSLNRDYRGNAVVFHSGESKSTSGSDDIFASYAFPGG